MQRGRADAESASECMAGLKSACADKLDALEERIAAALEAALTIQAAEHKQGWASGMAQTLTPSFLMPRK